MERAVFVRRARQRNSTLASAPVSFAIRNFSTLSAMAAVTAARTSFKSFPTIGFSSLPSDFICSLQAEMLPLRPR